MVLAMTFGDPEYYVRRTAIRGEYLVAVFRGSKEPSNLYTVRGIHCSCPAGGGESHKHVELVRKFKEMGEPEEMVFFNEPTGWEGHTYGR